MSENGAATADPPIPGQLDTAGGEAAPPPLDRIVVAGTVSLDTISDGGAKEPQTATLTITGAKADVRSGEGFRRGDVITGTFVARVVQAAPVDKIDKQTSLVSEAVQTCKAVLTDLTVDDSMSG